MDPQLQLELEICYDYKIFHSDYLRRSADDRDKAIWTHIGKREICPYCGTSDKEWDEEQGGHRRAYVPRIHECEGCIVRERTQSAPELKEGRGRRVILVRNPELR